MQLVLTVNVVCVVVHVDDVDHEDTSLLQSIVGGRRQRSSASQSHDVDDESSSSSSSGFNSSESCRTVQGKEDRDREDR